jgi:hypothetical protein
MLIAYLAKVKERLTEVKRAVMKVLMMAVKLDAH